MIVTDRWQKFSDVHLNEKVLNFLAEYADEFLVHGVDVEGKKLVPVICPLTIFVEFVTTVDTIILVKVLYNSDLLSSQGALCLFQNFTMPLTELVEPLTANL